MALRDEDEGVLFDRKEFELENHKLFMRLACLAATRSRDDETKVGAVIVRNDREIVSTGYNGFVQHRTSGEYEPTAESTDNDSMFPWKKEDSNPLKKKDLYVVHAEHNAMMNTIGKDINGCKLYVTRFPCCECAKFVINSGISEVIYHEEKTDGKIYAAGKILLDKCPEVSHRKYSDALQDAGKADVSEEPKPTKFDYKTERPNWDQYFMAMAKIAAERSKEKDPRKKAGAVIVNANQRLVGIGYNGMPWGCEQAFGAKWRLNKPESNETDGWLDTKYPYVVQAVQMAIMNRNSANLKDCKLYVTLFPDNDCAKSIIQAKIKTVIYLEDQSTEDVSTEASKIMMKWAGVEFEKFGSACVIELKLVDEVVSLIPGEDGEKWKFKSEPVAYQAAQ